jgi:RNA polymerase-binding transcription factor DksA
MGLTKHISDREGVVSAAIRDTVDSDQFAALKRQIVQRCVLLLVLINENARTSDLDAGKNMFLVDEQEPEGLVIAKSERELTALVRALVWLDSEHAGLCSSCAEPIKNLNVENAVGSRLCVRCVKHGG